MVLFVHAHAFYTGETAGMMARIMTTTAIYQKVDLAMYSYVIIVILHVSYCVLFLLTCMQILKLSQVTIGKLSAGHIVNLASNDVQRFDLVKK